VEEGEEEVMAQASQGEQHASHVTREMRKLARLIISLQ
jgi:hypothetical protein